MKLGSEESLMRIDWFAVVLVAVLGALIVGLFWSKEVNERERLAACHRLYAMAQDHKDSMAVALKCEFKEDRRPQVIPMPIIVPTR